MSDFGDVDWGADAATDNIIDGLFGEVTSKLKKSKNGKKQSQINSEAVDSQTKYEGDSHSFTTSKSPQESNAKKQNSKRKKKRKIKEVCETNEQYDNLEDDVKLGFGFQNEKQSSSAKDSDSCIPRKIRKNKYYSLALSHKSATGKDSEQYEKKTKSSEQKESQSKATSPKVDGFIEHSNSDQNRKDKVTVNTDSINKNQSKKKRKSKKSGKHEGTGNSNPPGGKNVKLSDSENLNNKSSASPFNISRLRNILHHEDAGEQHGRLNAGTQSSAHMDEDFVPRSTDTSADSGPSKKSKKCNEKQKTLKERMEEKLKSARFRHLNEQLYTTTGTEAYDMFQGDLMAFQVYHDGFQSQVTKWPNNPLNRAIKYVCNRPRNHIVADFGCGDARLAASVKQTVHSFDLVAINSRVTACDMSKIPLAAESIDIGVFCLSLMGTNLLDYLLEAHRVLKLGGVLLVAEVISRFENVQNFVRKLAKLGFILLKKDTTNKMFVWFEFKKALDYDQALLPKIDLLPCIYKKR